MTKKKRKNDPQDIAVYAYKGRSVTPGSHQQGTLATKGASSLQQTWLASDSSEHRSRDKAHRACLESCDLPRLSRKLVAV